MTLAGTRPPLISETNLYELHHRARLAIKPGITGMWQVSGRSDITDFEEKEFYTLKNIAFSSSIITQRELVDKTGYVVKSFAKLIEAGVYQKNLFEDLK